MRQSREEYNRKQREWYAKNREAQRERTKKYYHDNKEREIERRAKRYADYKAHENRKNKLWSKNNPEKYAEYSARRRARIINATPGNVDHNAINAIYARCRFLNDLYGCDLQVDHVTPLDAGVEAGGIHHHTNLQLLDGSLNQSKGTKTDWLHPFNVDEMELTDPDIINWLDNL